MPNLSLIKVLIFCLIVTPVGVVRAEPRQINSQQASGSATATGKNATAITQVRQESHQKRDQGTNGAQISHQRANTNSVAEGENSTAVSGVNQQSSQTQFKGNDWTNPQTQISTQNSKVNNSATGARNTSVGGTQQQNSQSQSGF